jgi:hypothetical protein
MDAEQHRSWRLLPNERVLWHGRPDRSVPRSRKWRLPVLVLAVLAVDAALFAGLLWVSGVGAVRPTLMTAAYLALSAVAVGLLPSFLLDPCEFLVTDRRVLWRRGRMRRTMERHAITLARIVWHPKVPGVGDLELERAVPFGPLMRKQRLVLHDVRAPDALFAVVRDTEPSEHAGDVDVPLAERLDPGESLVWGGAPERAVPDWREIGTALLGAGLVVLALWYEWEMAARLLGWESLGMPVRSWTWLFFFLATFVAFAFLLSVGGYLLWHGLLRSRALAHDTEYILTERRLLIRRGRTELSVDRRRIVDVASEERRRGLHTLYLILDGPGGRALGDSGALGSVTPAKDTVPPILFEVRDAERLRRLILGERVSSPSVPPPEPLRDAA